MDKTKVYQEMAVRIQAIKNCQALDNSEWEIKHTEVLESLESLEA